MMLNHAAKLKNTSPIIFMKHNNPDNDPCSKFLRISYSGYFFANENYVKAFLLLSLKVHL